jgi:hypothetical protein
MTGSEKQHLHALYPTLSDKELEGAQEILDRYLELAWEVFEELSPEKRAELGKPKKRVDSVYREFDSSQGSAQSS